MENREEKWQLFWCHLLYPVIYEELEGSGITDYLRSLSKEEILFPDGKKRKPSMSTLWRKMRVYREKGTEGFIKKKRGDRGKIRVVAREVLDKAIEIKKDLPTRSAQTINTFLEEYYGTTLSKSTLYHGQARFPFKQAGQRYRLYPRCQSQGVAFYQLHHHSFQTPGQERRIERPLQ